MSLTTQSLLLATTSTAKILFNMPCEFLYPLVIHRSVDEAREKENGDRHRYSSKVVVSHLLSGGQLAVCPSYEKAYRLAKALQAEPIFLMPTVELLPKHPDWERVAAKVRDLKELYSIT